MDKISKRLKQELGLLKYRPRLMWHALFIRKDEFHKSLHMDVEAMLKMNKKQESKYLANLTRRRNLAHSRDLDHHS